MPAGPRIRANFAYGTTTDNPLTAGATSFNSAELPTLPVVSSAHAVVTLDPRRVFGEPEIVVVTTHTAAATVATITRGAYGTVARSHPQGTEWAHAPIDEDYIEILTSGTRPSDPYRGQQIFETDTNAFFARTTADTWANVNMLADPPACRVFNSTAITVGDAAVTAMTYDSERFDTAGMHSTAALTGRITFPVTGVYIVSFSGTLTASNDYTGIGVRIRLNGSGSTEIAMQSLQHNVITWSPVWTLTTIYKFTAGEWVDSAVYADNTAGAANRQVLASVNFSPEFSAVWVGRG